MCCTWRVSRSTGQTRLCSVPTWTRQYLSSTCRRSHIDSRRWAPAMTGSLLVARRLSGHTTCIYQSNSIWQNFRNRSCATLLPCMVNASLLFPVHAFARRSRATSDLLKGSAVIRQLGMTIKQHLIKNRLVTKINSYS